MNGASPTRHEWEIGLSAWVIQDGNYPDFEAGKLAGFALEFSSESFRSGGPKSKTAKPLGEAKYEVNSQIIYLAADAWIIDFGICAFQESTPPKNLNVGDFVAAEIYLGIDPFFYFGRLNRLPGIPPLVYSWKVNSIKRQTAPFVETQDPSGRKVPVRDQVKAGYKARQVADAWKDDDGHAEYVLNCAWLEVAPKFDGVTAT